VPTYMTGFDYEGQAWRLMVERPEDREAAARAVVEAAGGRLLSWYWMFGKHDGMLIFEAPSDEAAAAVLAAVAASGRVKRLQTSRLLTSDEARGAMALAKDLATAYAPPGGGDWRQGYDELGG